MKADVAPPLVSVIVPVFNAAATVLATLRSIAAQDYPNFEVIVIDDGSRDGAADLVNEFIASRPQFRLVSQANAGVAAARNRGVREARGEFIAPIDADDLWARDKLSAQMQAFAAGGPRLGLVYSWYDEIDADDRVLRTVRRRASRGGALASICRRNVVGNGSTPLMRRAAIEAVGGYDTSLRGAGSQGCEDWKLYALIAERYDFACVRRSLTGYRMVAGSMAHDVMQMLRSNEIVRQELVVRFPWHRRALLQQQTDLMMGLYLRARAVGQSDDARALLARMFRQDPLTALAIFAFHPFKGPARSLAAGGRSNLFSDKRPWT